MPSLHELVEYCDDYLRVRAIGDWTNALNGLQIENSGRVTKIGAAVDASTFTFNEAAARGVDFLIVHHGMFWPGLQPVTGSLQAKLKLAFAHDLALYSAHLPLDVHPEVGNNALLARAIGLMETQPFFEAKGQLIGLKATTALPARAELVRRLEVAVGGAVKLIAGGPEQPRTVAVITGGAGSEIHAVAQEGIDTFITGEAPHWAAVAAEELGVNLLLAGHYATETFGVKALAAHLGQRFNLPTEWIDHLTGL